jgi:hypothetical protein
MLSRTGRSCALMCDRTPDNARQEMLHARPRRDSLQVRPRRLRLQLCSGRGEGRRLNGGCCMMLLPAQPAPDIRAVKRSPRSTRACDPRAPPRWHGCLQVSACTYIQKKENIRYTNFSAVLRSLTPVRAICWCVCGGEPRVWRAMRDRALTVYACAWLLESAGTIGLWQPKTLPHRRQPSSGRTRTLQATKLW